VSAPKDPVAYEAWRARLRASHAARWARPGERERAREKAVAQYQRPGARELNAQRRREWWAQHPEERERLARAAPALNAARRVARQDTRAGRLALIAALHTRRQGTDPALGPRANRKPSP